jgi:hypothetical protein
MSNLVKSILTILLMAALVMLAAISLGVYAAQAGSWGLRGTTQVGKGQLIAAIAFPSGTTMAFLQRPRLEMTDLEIVVKGKDGEKLFKDTLPIAGVPKISVIACGQFAHVLVEQSNVTEGLGGNEVDRVTYDLGESVPCQTYLLYMPAVQ